MKFLNFFIIMWIVVAFAWQGTQVTKTNDARWYRMLEYVITAPVTVWGWIKIAVKTIVEKLNAEKN